MRNETQQTINYASNTSAIAQSDCVGWVEERNPTNHQFYFKHLSDRTIRLRRLG
ncbi:hypothetical protein [Scytonema sp. NUACC21]